MKAIMKLLMIVLLLNFTGTGLAGLSMDEAKKLGVSLTEIGAEKAGNADGTIPAYEGGLKTLPAGVEVTSGLRPDPFKAEKLLFRIDAKNVDNYANKLTEGTKALLKKHPTFRLDIYKSHRTVAFPEFVLKNTHKTALKAETAMEGLELKNAKAGFPFPIPKTGNEAMWNHLVRFEAITQKYNVESYNITSSGIPSLSTTGVFIDYYPYWDESSTIKDTNIFVIARADYIAPARRSGERVLIKDPLTYTKTGRRAWQYLPGQRRVRLAPDLSFDTPNPGTAGATVWDDTYLFNGSMERFDFKLIGKKEIYVPYNCYGLTYFQGDFKQMMAPHHLNPDIIRWELHRVWVVEGTLKKGKRHIYGKRTLYLDEDSWAAIAAENYDQKGEIYRVSFAHMSPSYDLPGPCAKTQVFYDLISGEWTVNMWLKNGLNYIDKLPDYEWSQDFLAGSGLR